MGSDDFLKIIPQEILPQKTAAANESKNSSEIELGSRDDLSDDIERCSSYDNTKKEPRVMTSTHDQILKDARAFITLDKTFKNTSTSKALQFNPSQQSINSNKNLVSSEAADKNSELVDDPYTLKAAKSTWIGDALKEMGH